MPRLDSHELLEIREDADEPTRGPGPWGPFVHPAVLLPSAMYSSATMDEQNGLEEAEERQTAPSKEAIRRTSGELPDRYPDQARDSLEDTSLRSFLLSLKRRLKELEELPQRQSYHNQTPSQKLMTHSHDEKNKTGDTQTENRAMKRSKLPFLCRKCYQGKSKRQGRNDHGWLIAYG